ncbi:MAG: fumarylacetoacetate hydrolase family protein [Chloroflexi bacterium]|nr:fumarylacetoacetate hydrolase family protein [Chloroflexota bacterium]
MKLVTFQVAGETHWGALRGENVIDLNLARAMFLAAHGQEIQYLAHDALAFIGKGEDAWDAANETLEFLGSRAVDGIVFPLHAVKLLAPILTAPKIIAIGLNYGSHRQEQDILEQEEFLPILFPKFPNSITGPDAPVTWDATLTKKVDYEAELGVIIGKRAHRVSEVEALEFVFGYCNLNDISSRDLQFHPKSGGQWGWGKSLDTFCPIGPFIATRDEIADPQNLAIKCWVNGEARQDSHTSNMINGVAKLISFISQGITLMPGDLIASGTPSGVGHFALPPVYLKPGDVVTVEVEGLGRLTNTIV